MKARLSASMAAMRQLRASSRGLAPAPLAGPPAHAANQPIHSFILHCTNTFVLCCSLYGIGG